jgi:hypothetical protein
MARMEGYRKWWEVKVYQGKDEQGNKIGIPAFRNMQTGEICAPENGWDGAPPNGEEAIPCHTPTEKFLAHYDDIRWDR